MICENKKLKMLLTSVIILTVLLFPLCVCSGVFYDEEFPSEIGLSGGYFVKANTSLSSNTVIIIPDNNKDSFAFTGSSQLVNTTNSTINCRVFVGRTVYYGRFQSFGTLEYRDNDYNYTWHSVTISKIIDLNIFPKSDNKEYANQNLHIQSDFRYLIFFGGAAFIILLIVMESVHKYD